MKELSRILRETREETGMSQARAAEILGIDPAMLSRIENGKQIPRWDFVERCIQRLDIQMEDFKRRGSQYKHKPKHAKAFKTVIKAFLTLPPPERRRLLSELAAVV